MDTALSLSYALALSLPSRGGTLTGTDTEPMNLPDSFSETLTQPWRFNDVYTAGRKGQRPPWGPSAMLVTESLLGTMSTWPLISFTDKIWQQSVAFPHVCVRLCACV